jgi:hypothetical protein
MAGLLAAPRRSCKTNPILYGAAGFIGAAYCLAHVSSLAKDEIVPGF